MNAYCLFCNAAKREMLANEIRRRFGLKAIVPRLVQRKWVKGVALEEIHDWLPGYLFLYSEAPFEETARLAQLDEVYRVLGERETGCRLMGSDLAFAEMLNRCDGVIGVLKAFRQGDRVKLADGVMGGVKGDIVRLDRRGRAQVRFDFDGASVTVWVAYDLIEPEAPEKPDAPAEA